MTNHQEELNNPNNLIKIKIEINNVIMLKILLRKRILEEDY